uniref:50S ribosomal protein L21, chloroplastic n=1 Tax=Mantoniella antarctica TaxID=81844 RepID=A0A6U3JL65_9CHLO|mmetsp:Transcript_42079/g.67630  ORF Transcript_42079/g.67630 Transcript_42079/m.67630 type:complete len:197 (+) Transcript_42079:74-664(+)
MSAMMSCTFASVAPARAVAGQRSGSAAARPAFFGKPAAVGVSDALASFSALSLSTPARKRGLSICAASEGAATSINQIGFTTPPSLGAAPTWDAIVEVGGSQQFVSEGRYYECHSLKGVEPGTKIAFERVLATLKDDEPTFGMPYVKGARVEATVLENFKDKKLIVFKYRRKKHYKRKNGHRQPMTRFLVTKVVKP